MNAPKVELKQKRRIANGLRWFPIGNHAQDELAAYLKALADSFSTVTLHDLVETAITAALCNDHEHTYGRPVTSAERNGYRYLAVNLACDALVGIDDALAIYLGQNARSTDPVLSYAIDAERDVREAIAEDERQAAANAAARSSSSSVAEVELVR